MELIKSLMPADNAKGFRTAIKSKRLLNKRSLISVIDGRAGEQDEVNKKVVREHFI